jgi:hypothetical protein
LSLTPEAERKAATVLARAEAGHASGNAHFAVRLLNQVVAAQAHRIAASLEAHDSVTLSTVIEADVPEHVDYDEQPSGEDWAGQYLLL